MSELPLTLSRLRPLVRVADGTVGLDPSPNAFWACLVPRGSQFMLKHLITKVDVFSEGIRMPERTSRSPNTTSADFASTFHGSCSALMQHLQRFSSLFDMIRGGGSVAVRIGFSGLCSM